jgi:hypothetical protein
MWLPIVYVGILLTAWYSGFYYDEIVQAIKEKRK